MMQIMDWYDQVTTGDTPNAVAANAGMVGSTLNRQLKSGVLSPESVVAIARAYSADPIDGLVALGLLTEHDVLQHGAEAFLEDLTDKMLADEVWTRMQRRKASDGVVGRQSRLKVVTNEETRDVPQTRRAALDPGYAPEDEPDGIV